VSLLPPHQLNRRNFFSGGEIGRVRDRPSPSPDRPAAGSGTALAIDVFEIATLIAPEPDAANPLNVMNARIRPFTSFMDG
jgi:hypothetical protein